ncbi:MAG: nucleoside transporter [Verrucomicrobia bacterium]|nr:nucleoside transporter [Verrucomicrobiota bacterium]
MDRYNFISLAGLVILLCFGWLISEKKRAVKLRTVLAGAGIQLAFGLLIFRVPAFSRIFLKLSALVVKILEAAYEGIHFLFGPLAIPPGQDGSLGFILIFQGLPTVVFFAALMGALYYLRVMPWIVKLFSRFFSWALRVSGAESLCASSNIFVGIESATTVLPYLNRMTRSELCTVITAGLATIASTVLGLYVILLKANFPNIAAHLISASLLSAPAAIVMSKLLVPEQEAPETLDSAVEPHCEKESSLIEAVMKGATAGGQLFIGIVVMLLAFLGLVALVNMGLDAVGAFVNARFDLALSLRLEDLLSYAFYPFALLLGIPAADALEVARLLGERAILTEVPAYQHLSSLIGEGAFINERSPVIASYALCGFAHIAAVAIFVGGVSALAPGRAGTLASIAIRALVAATLACLMTATVAGIFYTSGSLMIAG